LSQLVVATGEGAQAVEQRAASLAMNMRAELGTPLLWRRTLNASGFKHAVRQLADDYVFELYGLQPNGTGTLGRCCGAGDAGVR
jgi:hypothetical protein